MRLLAYLLFVLVFGFVFVAPVVRLLDGVSARVVEAAARVR